MALRPVSSMRAYGFAWVTGGFFLVSLAGHWIFGWFAFVSEQVAHGQPVSVADYLTIMMRDTLENWQSEFLQLLWQVVGLALLLYVGSPQSKEGDDRVEAKLDAVLRRIAPDEAEQIISEIGPWPRVRKSVTPMLNTDPKKLPWRTRA